MPNLDNAQHTLKAHQLKKRYRKKTAVHDFSFTLKSGEVIGLLGPNGAGKTTSFYMLVGLIRSDSGSLYLDDIDLTQLAIHQRAKLGLSYLPQESSIFRKLTTEDNIRAILELDSTLKRPEREEKLDALLNEFNITHIRHIPGYQLSGGERRRVEIARALCLNPKFILLDEPFSGIDPISVADLKKMITHLAAKGIGILITDHNVRETLDICHQAYIFNAGEIIAQGDANSLLNNEKVKKNYLGQEFSL